MSESDYVYLLVALISIAAIAFDITTSPSTIADDVRAKLPKCRVWDARRRP